MDAFPVMGMSVQVASIPPPIRIRDYRCPACGRLQFQGALPPGVEIRIRCPKCSVMHVFKTVVAGLCISEG